MLDEKKEYLVNIESNLKQYAQDATDAKKRVDELKASLDAMKKSGVTSGADFEMLSAKLRNAQKEYINSKNNLNVLTTAMKQNATQRELLVAGVNVELQKLKQLGTGYIADANGLMRVNPLYVQQKKNLADANLALINYDKSLHSGRTSVGLYSEAIQGALGQMSILPGVAGRAGSAIQSFVMSFSKIGLIGSVIGGALAMISAPFIAFLTKSEEGMHLLEQKTAGFKAAINVLTGDLIKMGRTMTETLSGAKEGTAPKEGGLIDRMTNGFVALFKIAQQLIPGFKTVSTYVGDLTVRMGSAAKVAEDYTKKEQELYEVETKLIKSRAETNLQIKEARLLFADTTKSIDVRVAALQKAFNLENQTADAEIKHQKEVIANMEVIKTEKLKTEKWLPEDERALQEAIAKELNLRTESAGRMIRGQKQLYAALADMRKDEFALQLLEARGNDEEIKKVLKDQLDFQLQNTELTNTQKKTLRFQYDDAIRKMDDEAFQKFVDYWDKQDKIDEERRKANIKAGIDYRKLKAETEQTTAIETNDILSGILDEEYQDMIKSVDYERLTTNQKLLVDQQYTNAKKQLLQKRKGYLIEEKLAVAGSLGAMSEVVGKQTAMGKAFAVAEAIINTWAAASKTLNDPTIPSTFARIAMMVTVIATGLANVKNILAVDVSGKGTASSSAPTAISSALPAQRAFAEQAGSNIFNQPALTQTQLNTTANQNLLTADDIANAMKKIPAPIVTVEDINAKIKEKQKVDVRANI